MFVFRGAHVYKSRKTNILIYEYLFAISIYKYIFTMTSRIYIKSCRSFRSVYFIYSTPQEKYWVWQGDNTVTPFGRLAFRSLKIPWVNWVSVAYYDFLALKQLPLSALMVLDASLGQLAVTSKSGGRFPIGFIGVLFTNALNQQMVNCWFGLVVWVPGIPLWKGVLLGCTLRIPNHQPKPTINH